MKEDFSTKQQTLMAWSKMLLNDGKISTSQYNKMIQEIKKKIS
jgi:mannitol/fructose-specific phosphotransferase system IIA component (Ntr-type)